LVPADTDILADQDASVASNQLESNVALDAEASTAPDASSPLIGQLQADNQVTSAPAAGSVAVATDVIADEATGLSPS